MKEVVVNYESSEKGCYLLDSKDNGGVRGFDEESFNSLGSINV